MTYNAKAVANYFLKIAKNKGDSLTPMKLQKLLFFSHGWHLALFNKPLINEAVEAWKFGPVVPSIYHEFKPARSGSIFSMAKDIDFENLDFIEPQLSDENKRIKALLDKIFDLYGKYSDIRLSFLTHLPGTPWDQMRKAGLDNRNQIDDELIRSYFKEKALENTSKQLNQVMNDPVISQTNIRQGIIHE